MVTPGGIDNRRGGLVCKAAAEIGRRPAAMTDTDLRLSGAPPHPRRALALVLAAALMLGGCVVGAGAGTGGGGIGLGYGTVPVTGSAVGVSVGSGGVGFGAVTGVTVPVTFGRRPDPASRRPEGARGWPRGAGVLSVLAGPTPATPAAIAAVAPFHVGASALTPPQLAAARAARPGFWALDRLTLAPAGAGTVAGADGIRIAGFALDATGRPHDGDLWRRQMNQALAAARRGQAVVLDVAAEASADLGFAVASYLLVRGQTTYLALPAPVAPAYPPALAVPMPLQYAPLAREIDALDSGGDGIYRRRFADVTVLVRPPGEAAMPARPVQGLPRPAWRLLAEGSGRIGPDGAADIRVRAVPVDALVLAPGEAAIVSARPPPQS